jgi:hypothetical protein
MVAEISVKKRRGPKTTRLMIDFGQAIPEILLAEAALPPYPHSTILAPTDDAELARQRAEWNSHSVLMMVERFCAALKVFEITGSDLDDGAGMRALHKVFLRVFPGYKMEFNGKGDLPRGKWTAFDRKAMGIYLMALKNRQGGMTPRQAWIEAARELGVRIADQSILARWQDFKKDTFVRAIEKTAADRRLGLAFAIEFAETMANNLTEDQATK